jgi:hypothetical protein
MGCDIAFDQPCSVETGLFRGSDNPVLEKAHKLTRLYRGYCVSVAEMPPRKPWHPLAAAGLYFRQPVFDVRKPKQAHLTKPATTILYGMLLPPYPPGKPFPCGYGFLWCFFTGENHEQH